jgi:hypothetical protein
MWGAHSDERTDLSFARVTVSSCKSVVNMYNLNLHAIKHIYIYIYIYIYMQGVCQSRLSTAYHTLLLIAPPTTAVYSLERSYACSMSLLCFTTISSNVFSVPFIHTSFKQTRLFVCWRKRDEIIAEWENCKVRSFIICTVRRIQLELSSHWGRDMQGI